MTNQSEELNKAVKTICAIKNGNDPAAIQKADEILKDGMKPSDLEWVNFQCVIDKFNTAVENIEDFQQAVIKPVSQYFTEQTDLSLAEKAKAAKATLCLASVLTSKPDTSAECTDAIQTTVGKMKQKGIAVGK